MAYREDNGSHRGHVLPKAVPERLRPIGWQIPRLAWTMARADAPGGWRLIALFSALLMYAPILAGALAVGEVASLDTRAVMILRLNEPLRCRLMRVLATMATFAIVWGVLCAVFAWIPPMAGEIARRTHSPAAGVAFGQVAPVPFVAGPVFVVMVARLRLIGVMVSGAAGERVVRSRLGQARPGGVRVAGFAAYPQGCGHGGRLADAVAPVVEAAVRASGRPLIVLARTGALALVYQRWGLHLVAPGSRVLTSELSPVSAPRDD